jgi:hypothetical protein
MLIYCNFHPTFYHVNVNNKDRFSVDVDPNDDIDKLKTVITM